MMRMFVKARFLYSGADIETALETLLAYKCEVVPIEQYFNPAMIINFVIVRDNEVHFDISGRSDCHFISNDIGFFRSLIEGE